MATKDPGYYRNLLESIEHQASETVAEDKGQLTATAQAIKADLAKALNSKDTSEIMRLVQGAHNSMDEVLLTIRRGGVAEAYGRGGPRRGDSVDAGMGMVMTRHKGTPDEAEYDVWIEYTATMVSPGFAGDRTDPGHGPEWEFEINSIELDLPKGISPEPGDELTPKEREEITTWFHQHEDDAAERADDQLSNY
jgi:hypothetical protein